MVKLYEGYHGIGECVLRAGAILIMCVFATWPVEYLSQSCNCLFLPSSVLVDVIFLCLVQCY